MPPQANPDDLALFVHVVDAGSFTAAAERLGLPKSTLSRRISALEVLLGERLMQRSTRRLVVTEFGHALLEHARQVVAEVDSVMALAQHRQARPSGVLRVSMPGDIAMLALGDALATFVAAHPAVTLELDLSPRRVDLLAESVDLAVRMGDLPDDAHLSARLLARFSGGLYAAPSWLARHGPPEHPSQLLGADCALHALVLAGPGAAARPWALSRRDAGGGQEVWTGLPTRQTRANSPALLMQLACAGVGLTAVADFFAAPHVQAGALAPVLVDWRLPPVAAWAVFPERRLMPAKTRAFLDALALALQPCRGQPATPGNLQGVASLPQQGESFP
jgi:DNA-binding transcriptional LysR family regulator